MPQLLRQRTYFLWLALTSLIGLGLLSPAFSQSAEVTSINKVPPAPQGLNIYVTDLGQLIDDNIEAELSQYLAKVDESGFGQVVILTLPDTDRELSAFSPEIMNQWGIGDKKKDNGVLILANAKRITENLSGNRIFLGTGYGVEGLIPDAVAGRILDQFAIPAFSQQDYSTGLANTAIATTKILQGDKALIQQTRGTKREPTELPPWAIILFIIIIVGLRIAGVPIYVGGGGYRGGGFGSGGGFGGGFGGGGSGGGGAGR